VGRLHIASWALLLGAIGQGVFYASLFPGFPVWALTTRLLPPWLTIYIISFCRQAPFGPRPFRYALIFAMWWYALATLLAETLNFVAHSARWGGLSALAARSVMYLSALSFAVFVPLCAAKKPEAEVLHARRVPEIRVGALPWLFNLHRANPRRPRWGGLAFISSTVTACKEAAL
jgi:hypothetical protein